MTGPILIPLSPRGDAPKLGDRCACGEPGGVNVGSLSAGSFPPRPCNGLGFLFRV